MNRDELLNELMALDFMAVDLQLFMDTHPRDCQAREKYNAILHKAHEYREQYQKLCGPMYSFRSLSRDGDWIDDPWPWQYSFNTKLRGCC